MVLLAASCFVAVLAIAVHFMRNEGTKPAPLPGDTRVLLVTIDTLRPDAVGFVLGLNDTPQIDALAAAGVRFKGAITQVPLTLPSHTTIMTGVYPTRHGVHVNGEALAKEVPTLAEQFQAHGHATAAFVSATVLKHDFGLSRGFDVYDDAEDSLNQGLLQRHAVQTVAAASSWIEQQGDRPWFVWVHLYDAHMPYDPPRIFWKPGPRGAYDGAVTYVDNSLSGLIETARKSAGDKLLSIVTADHGEAFGEHGEIQHGIFLYDTTMRVPLVVNYPGIFAPASPAFVPRLVDLMPTLLDGFGWNAPGALDGISLMSGLSGKVQEVPPAYMESEFPWTSYGWAPLHGLHTGDWKFISAPSPELYDLTDDAGEQRNRVIDAADRAEKMTAQIDRIRLEPPIADAGQVTDVSTMSRLQSLGYVGAGNAIGPAPEGRPDPKTRTDIRYRIHDADARLTAEGETPAVAALYADVLKDDPENRYVLVKYGILSLHIGDLDTAISLLQRALEQSSEQSDAQFALADALTRAKRFPEALQHWLETVRLQPHRVDAWTNLGSTAIWAGDPERAILAYREALKIAPDNPGSLGNLGEAERLAGSKEDAAVHLIAAAQREAGNSHRASRIGLLLADLDRWDQAEDWLRRADAADDDYASGRIALARRLLKRGDTVGAREILLDGCQAQPALAELVDNEAEWGAMAGVCEQAGHSPQPHKR